MITGCNAFPNTRSAVSNVFRLTWRWILSVTAIRVERPAQKSRNTFIFFRRGEASIPKSSRRGKLPTGGGYSGAVKTPFGGYNR